MGLRGPIVLAVGDGKMISYKCTKCGAELASPSGMAGQEETCPECGTICVVPEEVPGPIVEEPIPDGKVDSPAKVDAWFKKWKKELPQIDSAYVPSGEASAAGYDHGVKTEQKPADGRDQADESEITYAAHGSRSMNRIVCHGSAPSRDGGGDIRAIFVVPEITAVSNPNSNPPNAAVNANRSSFAFIVVPRP